MKTFFTFLLLFQSFSSFAASREIRLEGDDAENVQDLFREAGKSSASGVIPQFSTSSILFEFETVGRGVKIRCRTMNPSSRSSSSCNIAVDRGHSSPSVMIEDLSANVTQATLLDSTTVAQLERALRGKDFTSEAKAADGRTPKLQLTCTERKICRLTVAN